MKHLFASIITPAAMALTFDISSNTNIIGDVISIETNQTTGLAELGREHGIGAQEIKNANPEIRKAAQSGQEITIPSQFILPKAERKGIVINLAEMRLYFFHPNGKKVYTYPIGIGKEGWSTPLGKTTIVTKREKPTWNVPESIKRESAERNIDLPDSIPPGPNNPLGEYAMNLGIGGIMIHGSLLPDGIGQRSSHGCIRMLNPDVKELFQMVEINTSVEIIHEPIKIGYEGRTLFIEAHKPLTEGDLQKSFSVQKLINAIAERFPDAQVDWEKAESILKLKTGIPSPAGFIR